tara:strand:+ start:54 stop:542 length:489 start_codon:yes stop_codon:yes gene_type:complete
MNIELKNIKIYNDLSEETRCFTATLYIDGVNKGRVENRGVGGCNNYDMRYTEIDKIDEWCKSNLPKYEYDGEKYEKGLEIYLEEILDEFENRKWIVSQFRRNILVVDDTCKSGEYKKWKIQPNWKLQMDKVYDKLENLDSLKNPIILNKLEPIKAYTLIMKR